MNIPKIQPLKVTNINYNVYEELMSSNNGQFKCQACGTIFNSQEEMEEHGRKEHNK